MKLQKKIRNAYTHRPKMGMNKYKLGARAGIEYYERSPFNANWQAWYGHSNRITSLPSNSSLYLMLFASAKNQPNGKLFDKSILNYFHLPSKFIYAVLVILFVCGVCIRHIAHIHSHLANLYLYCTLNFLVPCWNIKVNISRIFFVNVSLLLQMNGTSV